MTDIFLDCEWADVCSSELVSIGLISQDGEKQFYAEREVLPCDPTPWVAAVVYPLLERGDSALSDVTMTNALRAFVASFERPRIYYDAHADRALCQRILDGSDDRSVDSSSPTRNSLRWHLVTETEDALKRWWREHPEAGRRRHHALEDAKALRAAWLSLWGV